MSYYFTATLTTAAVACATVTAIPLLGFTTAGVAAGSVAAGVMSGIGNVAAGSAFAFLQSAGTMISFKAFATAGAIFTTAAATTAVNGL